MINLNREQTINLLLASIAFEELGLAHLINAEAEKVQFVLGTLEGTHHCWQPSFNDLLKLNRSVGKTLQDIIKKEMLLQFKLEEIVENLVSDHNKDCEEDEYVSPYNRFSKLNESFRKK